jgi:hypothetical protein
MRSRRIRDGRLRSQSRLPALVQTLSSGSTVDSFPATGYAGEPRFAATLAFRKFGVRSTLRNERNQGFVCTEMRTAGRGGTKPSLLKLA